ncbi:MAG: NfeD family protein [Candidatus Cyclobacteriaceae bacterium M2_1C_046]
MTAWIIVVILVLIGLFLINIEVIFVPGTTFVGLLGVLFAGAGIAYSFIKFENNTGFYVLGVTLALSLFTLVYFFKNQTWKKFSLEDVNKGRVNEGLTGALKVGQEGTAVSSLRPMGKAEFFGQEYEVSTLGDYTDAGTKLTIIKIESNKILVEPIKS